jgi:hypothetical protein
MGELKTGSHASHTAVGTGMGDRNDRLGLGLTDRAKAAID